MFIRNQLYVGQRALPESPAREPCQRALPESPAREPCQRIDEREKRTKLIKTENRKYRPYGDRYDTKILVARESDGMIITTCTSFDEAAEFVGVVTPLHVLDALINEESLNGYKFFVPFRYACNEYGMHVMEYVID